MLNYIAIAFLAWVVSGPLDVEGSPSPITVTSATRRCPIILGTQRPPRDRSSRRSWRSLVIGLLLYPDDARLRDPDRRREPGRRAVRRHAPKRLIDLTMSVAGLLAGMAGRCELLGSTHHMTASSGRRSASTRSPWPCSARTSPSGSCSPRCCSGRCAAGAGPMQIQAGVPAELVDVLQATILFFLVASPVIRRVFRSEGC